MFDRANRKPKIIKIPGADHPITIERNARRIVVVIAGRVVADTQAALTLREAPAGSVYSTQGRGHRPARANRPRDVLPIQG
jgi:uncharacterized protein (DUF427 family)